MKERKHEAPPRYDAAFKEGAIRLVAEEGRPMREVAEELGVCTDTIRNWLKASGIQPKETERQNRLERRQRVHGAPGMHPLLSHALTRLEPEYFSQQTQLPQLLLKEKAPT